ncbi:50S ribosomal protein L18 [Candidatus Uhrbacteria bacterium]|nr:50S ribosomal protein L18 [Candidatus Uhrbacteria bacterium]
MRQSKQASKMRRARRTRARITGTSVRPRLSVFRSAKHFSAQMIDDGHGVTMVSVNDHEVKGSKPMEIATLLGALMAKKAEEKKIESVVFDRGSYAYHGRVKAFAEAAREGGLQF